MTLASNASTLASLVDSLAARGVVLSFEGSRLRFLAPPDALTPQDRSRLTERRDDVLALLRDRARGRSETHDLSFGQQAIWLLDQVTPDSAVNNLAVALRVHAPVDPAASRMAAQSLVDRHPMLRSTFHVGDDGALSQRVAALGSAEVSIHDAEGLDEASLRVAIEAERDRRFDLQRGPLLRVALFRCGPADHIRLLVAHHIVSDGWSMLILSGEEVALWRELGGGVAAALPVAKSLYTDFVRAQRELVTSPAGQRFSRYWAQQLADLPSVVVLPTDHPRTARPSFRGGSVPIAVPVAVAARIRDLAAETKTTPFTVLLTSFTLFLARLAGVADLVVGTPASERHDPKTLGTVGDYVNALPLRARWRASTSFREGIAQHWATAQDAFAARAYPIVKIIEDLRPERGATSSPLFNCFFNFQQLPATRDIVLLSAGHRDSLTHDGVQLDMYRLAQQAGQFDLTLSLSWFGDGLRGSLDFATDLFEAGTAQRLASDYLTALAAMTAEPEETRLPRAERQRAVAAFNDTARTLDPRPFVVQFAASAGRTPERCAARCGSEAIGYAALDRAANRLAWRLRRAGVARATCVGLSVQRSLSMLIALLAVQKAGGTYVPLDPAFPASRLAFMAEDSGLTVLVSDDGRPVWLEAGVTLVDLSGMDGIKSENVEINSVVENRTDVLDENAEATTAPPHEATPADIAYILYTSGSTGRPNGVRISHAALSNFLGAMRLEPGIAATDTLAAVTTMSFDIAALELFLPLLVGATVEIVQRHEASDGPALARRLADADVTIMQATPATWRLLVETDWRPAPGFRALSGGEALRPDLVAALLDRGVSLWNLYGPTEATVHATAGRVTTHEAITVGTPIANLRIYVLDHQDDPVPIGTEGHVWIGGAGVATGYHRRPDLTAERFRPDPFAVSPHARMYRTGDRGRWDDAGQLVLLGRADDQIKIRGFRVEPGDIEAALVSHPEVKQAVVTASPNGDDVRLVAYCVHVSGAAPLPNEMRDFLRGLLPDYMVPGLFVAIDTVPLTANGKVDRRSLPDPFAGAATSHPRRPPSPGFETAFADIWKDVLGLSEVSADDRFFDIGGHSLLTLRVAAETKRRFGLTVPPTMLFFQSLSQIASHLAQNTKGPASQSGLKRWFRKS